MRNKKLLRMVEAAMLVAIMMVLYFAGVGILLIPPVSITTLVIPVIVGAIVLGPSYGAFLGGFFGILSMWMASTAASSPADLAFSPFLSGNPISSIIMCIGVRIFFGWFAGMIHKLLRSRINSNLSVVISTVAGVSIHTILVMTCLWLLFPALGVAFKAVISAVASINFVLEVGLSLVFALAFANILPRINKLN